MFETKQLPGGRLWEKGRLFTESWEAEDGSFRIIPTKNGSDFLLISFDHDSVPGSGQDYWTKRFSTVEAAMDYAERM